MCMCVYIYIYSAPGVRIESGARRLREMTRRDAI